MADSVSFVRENNGKTVRVTEIVKSNLVRVQNKETQEISPIIQIEGLMGPEASDAGRQFHWYTVEAVNYAKANLLNKDVKLVYVGTPTDPTAVSRENYLLGNLYLPNGQLYARKAIGEGQGYYDSRQQDKLTKFNIEATEKKTISDALYEAEAAARAAASKSKDKTLKSVWRAEKASDFGHMYLLSVLHKPTALLDSATKKFVGIEETKSNINADPGKKKVVQTRTYSKTTVGDDLGRRSGNYFPTASSIEIVKGIAAGKIDRSVTQIGPLWAGLPTAVAEANGRNTGVVVERVRQVRKEGDIQKMFSTGMLRIAMGDSPPFEGVQIDMTVTPEGVEEFLVPLTALLRSDPIIPIRNVHLAPICKSNLSES